MKIDKNKLIELLVEKTDMGRDEIENQLDQLIERILDAAKRGKALEIKEFGLFYFDEQGELSFDPAEELSTEISFKYAGMKPVELKPERDTSIFEAEEPDKKSDDTEEKDPFYYLEEDEEKEISESPKSETEDDDESIDDSFYDLFDPDDMKPLDEPAKEEQITKNEDIKPVSPRRPVKKQRDRTGAFILIGIILAAVLIGVYFYYTGTQTQELDEQTESTAQTEANAEQQEEMAAENLSATETENGNSGQANQDQQTTDETQDGSEQTSSGQVSQEENDTNSGVSVVETNQALHGLTGSVAQEATNAYSIVLHSFRSEDRALSAADRLREDGYRVIINSRTVYENEVWRVSVGQFETLEDAQQATTRLPNPYNTQNFIQRIRSN